jgi:carbon storage regulator
MLVLSRKQTERVRLGESVVLTIVRVSGDKVRVGIEAPQNVVVLRSELKPRSEEPGSAGPGSESGGEPGGEIRKAG